LQKKDNCSIENLGIENLEAGLQEEAVLPREAYALLAQANLLRMRGHWDEAAQSCMAALRLAPDSSSANSLLGDIYENQGRYDDAAQWYRMALDANPDSLADLLKLDRLRQREEQRVPDRPAVVSTAKAAAVKKAADAPTLSSRLPRFLLPSFLRDPELALRYGAIAAALALVLVVGFAYRAVHHAGALRALGLGGDAVVNSKPVVVPPVAGTLPSDPDAVPAHDPSEQALLSALQASRDLSSLGIVVYDVQADPRAGRMTITFGLPPSAELTQAEVAHNALRVLQAAGSASSVETWTVRCLLVPSAAGSAATLAFLGDASQDAVQASSAAGDGLTDVQAEAVFSNVWWSSTADIRA
jgi:tetratricopeptide (TPR) repeat protein